MELLELVRQRKEHLVGRYRDAKSVGLQWLKDELRVRLSEVDALLAEFTDPAPPAPSADSAPAAEQAPKAAASRRTSTGKPAARRRAAASSEAPAKRTRGRQAQDAPAAPRRKARNLSELIDPRVMVPLLKHGAMSPKDITSALGCRVLGPVMSGWKRTAARLGADLEDLLVKEKAESGEDIYRLTARGREVLAPEAGDVEQPPVAPAGASMATVPTAVVGSPEPAPAV